MKTKYKSAELPHLFVHRSVPEGRGTGNGSFRDGAFYSFSTVIARHGEHAGKPYIVHDDSRLSSHTCKVQSQLRRAFTPEIPVFQFNAGIRGQTLRVTPAQLFDHAVKQSAECEAKAAKARTYKESHTRRAAEWLEKASQINSFFGLRRKVDAKVVDRLKAAALREEKKNAAERKRRNAEQEVRNAERLALSRIHYADWISGLNVPTYDFNGFPVAFRIEDEELVSTLGARVPLDSARVAIRFILRRRGADWRENGETCPIGHYRLNSINPQGVVAGCHRVDWKEIDRVAGMLAEPVQA